MPIRSAGIMLFRRTPAGIEVMLAHPGGPFWVGKDLGAWSIPKGIHEPGEAPDAAARREFQEETGRSIDGPLMPLGDFPQPGGKVVTAFAAEGDLDTATLASNSFAMEWPPKSGRQAAFPEVDRFGWFDPASAAERLHKGQRPILAALLARLSGVSEA